MGPLVALVMLPIAIGAITHALFRRPSQASLAATLLSPVATWVCVESGDPGGSWNWLAVLLVSPLIIAFAIAVVVYLDGRRQSRNGA